MRFLATGDAHIRQQYVFQISKQTIGQIVPEVCQAIVGALKENIRVKVMYLTDQIVSHVKSKGWNTETKYISHN